MLRPLIGLALAVGLSGPARATSLLYSFTGTGDGADPQSGLVSDGAGTLYGTACLDAETSDAGTIFSLVPAAAGQTGWQFTLLFSFAADNSQGQMPCSTLLRAQNGTLYGTARSGGADDAGTVFSLTPPASPGAAWHLTTLHNFSFGKSDGATPSGGVIADAQGNLYGTTLQGGLGCASDLGCGVVYELSPPLARGGAWTETILHYFNGRTGHAGFPAGLLVLTSQGALIGTVSDAVFTLTPPSGRAESRATKWRYQRLPVSPALPPVIQAGITAGPDGTLFGVSELGGKNNTGTIFSLTPPNAPGEPWAIAILHDFGPIEGNTDGENPATPMIADRHGTLYGTVNFGGAHGGGTVFRLDPPATPGGSWTFTTLAALGGNASLDGDMPGDTPLLLGDMLYFSNGSGGAALDGTIVSVKK